MIFCVNVCNFQYFCALNSAVTVYLRRSGGLIVSLTFSVMTFCNRYLTLEKFCTLHVVNRPNLELSLLIVYLFRGVSTSLIFRLYFFIAAQTAQVAWSV